MVTRRRTFLLPAVWLLLATLEVGGSAASAQEWWARQRELGARRARALGSKIEESASHHSEFIRRIDTVVYYGDPADKAPRQLYQSWLDFWQRDLGAFHLLLDQSREASILGVCAQEVGLRNQSPYAEFLWVQAHVLQKHPRALPEDEGGGPGGWPKDTWQFYLDLHVDAEIVAVLEDETCLLDYTVYGDLITAADTIIQRGVILEGRRAPPGEAARSREGPGEEGPFASFTIQASPVVLWTAMLPDMRADILQWFRSHHPEADHPVQLEAALGAMKQWYGLHESGNLDVMLHLAYKSPKWSRRYDWQIVGPGGTAQVGAVVGLAVHEGRGGCPRPARPEALADDEPAPRPTSGAAAPVASLFPHSLRMTSAAEPQAAARVVQLDKVNTWWENGLSEVLDRAGASVDDAALSEQWRGAWAGHLGNVQAIRKRQVQVTFVERFGSAVMEEWGACFTEAWRGDKWLQARTEAVWAGRLDPEAHAVTGDIWTPSPPPAAAPPPPPPAQGPVATREGCPLPSEKTFKVHIYPDETDDYGPKHRWRHVIEILRALRADEAIYTHDPEEADFFVLVYHQEAAVSDLDFPAKEAAFTAFLRMVQSSWPYLNRSIAAGVPDHLLIIPGDHGPGDSNWYLRRSHCFNGTAPEPPSGGEPESVIPREFNPACPERILMYAVYPGQNDQVRVPQHEVVRTECDVCFQKGKDIRLPSADFDRKSLYQAASQSSVVTWTRYNKEERTTFFLFRGQLPEKAQENDTFRRIGRQQLLSFRNRTGWDVGSYSRGSDGDLMSHSVFCYNPLGVSGGDSLRYVPATLFGCITVWLSWRGEVARPYEDIIPWDRMSVTVPVESLDDLPQILEEVTEEERERMFAEMKKYYSFLLWGPGIFKHDDLGFGGVLEGKEDAYGGLLEVLQYRYNKRKGLKC